MDDPKLNLSLDDIIKLNRKSAPKKNQEGANKRLRNLGSRSGIIGRGGPKPAQRPARQNNNDNTKSEQPTMLHVSNLHYNVSNEDVRELFSDVGPVKKAVLHYDKSGRSLGTAEVTYKTRAAALRAIQRFHNQNLDARPMKVTLVPTGQTPVRSPVKDRMGIKAGSGVYKRPQTKNPRGGQTTTNKPRATTSTRGNKSSNFQQRGQRQPKKPVTAEDLDADLEAYTSNAMDICV